MLYLKFYAKANNQNLSKRKQIEQLQNEKNEIRMENLKLRKEIGKLENNFCGKKYEMCPTNDITMPNTQWVNANCATSYQNYMVNMHCYTKNVLILIIP